MSALKEAMQALGDAAETAARAIQKRDALATAWREANEEANEAESHFEQLRKTLYGSVTDRARELKETA